MGHLNNLPFIWRGFNNHNSFAGVGMAIPDRVNLFRAQSARAVGANAWRMSHDPPIPILLDILDRLGFVVWDENREFGENDIWVGNQKDMVKRDRNHPSVMVWSFCNERHCNLSGNADLESKVAKEFRKVSYEEDTFRPVSANVNPKSEDSRQYWTYRDYHIVTALCLINITQQAISQPTTDWIRMLFLQDSAWRTYN